MARAIPFGVWNCTAASKPSVDPLLPVPMIGFQSSRDASDPSIAASTTCSVPLLAMKTPRA